MTKENVIILVITYVSKTEYDIIYSVLYYILSLSYFVD